MDRQIGRFFFAKARHITSHGKQQKENKMIEKAAKQQPGKVVVQSKKEAKENIRAVIPLVEIASFGKNERTANNN